MCSNGNVTLNSLNVVTESVVVKLSLEWIMDMFVQSGSAYIRFGTLFQRELLAS